MTEQFAMVNDETIIQEFRDTLGLHKTIIVTGDEGVGKITTSLNALQDVANIFFFGNPLDYRGHTRPGGYEQYLDHIRKLKPDLTIIATEKEMLALAPSLLTACRATLLVDEVYGRSDVQRAKLYKLTATEGVKTVVVTGCMKNLYSLTELVDAGLLLTGRSAIYIEGDYIRKVCRHLRPESFATEK